jgi:hypothetical protein
VHLSTGVQAEHKYEKESKVRHDELSRTYKTPNSRRKMEVQVGQALQGHPVAFSHKG